MTSDLSTASGDGNGASCQPAAKRKAFIWRALGQWPGPTLSLLRRGGDIPACQFQIARSGIRRVAIADPSGRTLGSRVSGTHRFHRSAQSGPPRWTAKRRPGVDVHQSFPPAVSCPPPVPSEGESKPERPRLAPCLWVSCQLMYLGAPQKGLRQGRPRGFRRQWCQSKHAQPNCARHVGGGTRPPPPKWPTSHTLAERAGSESTELK